MRGWRVIKNEFGPKNTKVTSDRNLSLSVSILSPNWRQNGDRMETNDFF